MEGRREGDMRARFPIRIESKGQGSMAKAEIFTIDEVGWSGRRKERDNKKDEVDWEMMSGRDMCVIQSKHKSRS